MFQQRTLGEMSSVQTNTTGNLVEHQSPSVESADYSVSNLLCFSHLRWNFVYQRPQHLLSRASQMLRVWFIEEPIYGDRQWVETRAVSETITVVVPHLKHGMPHEEIIHQQREVVNGLLGDNDIQEYVAWYYTPMALRFSDHLTPRLTIYDCMDELSAFLGAPPSLLEQEKALLDKADLVFTGGLSLYEAKQNRHANVFAFPSSIDYTHFEPARHSITRTHRYAGYSGRTPNWILWGNR